MKKTLTKNQFVKLLNLAIKTEDSEDKFSGAIKDYFGCSHPHQTNVAVSIIDWLADVMGDDDDVISWWVWDIPDRGNADDWSCTITSHNGEQVVEWVLKTSGDLYDYLTRD